MLTAKDIQHILNQYKSDEARRRKLYDYYQGKHNIIYRVLSDSNKPNNKIVNAFPNYITDMITGYFMGNPVVYTSSDEDYLEKLQDVLDYNDEQNHNVEISKDQSIYGVAYELLYLDENADIRFKKINPQNTILILNNTLDEDMLYGIRYYKNNILNPDEITLELYSLYDITTYTMEGENLKFIERVDHPFRMVPIAAYYNNEEEMGDFEIVMSLVDAFDKLASDNVNDFEQFADAYLKLKGMEGTDSDDVAAMRENRVLILPEDGDADWLIKQINDTYLQNTLESIQNNIHKFSKVPAMTDENFGGNLSGIALRYKLIGLENKVATKESYFKKGLQRRIELITNIFYTLGSQYDYRDISMIFSRNLPANEKEAAELANMLWGIVSDETVLAQLPFVNDPAKEIEKKNSQLSIYSDFEENVENEVENEPIST